MIRSLLVVIAALSISLPAVSQKVIEDDGVSLSRQELENLVKFWTPEMQQAAAKDPGDRLELLSMALANKKIAALAQSAKPDTEAYWRQIFSIRNIQTQFVVKQYLDTLEVPDMSTLAEERYVTQKDRFALVPEERYASHILLLCAPGNCDRDVRRVEAQKILAELEAGADFRELATKYTEDPGSKDKGGQFDRWLKLGEAHVDPYFLGAVFELEKPGMHSGIVDTRFGLHIVRLDDVRPAHYKPYEEVREQIIATLRHEYVELAAKQFDAKFRLTDEAKMNYEALDEIFSAYQPDAAAK